MITKLYLFRACRPDLPNGRMDAIIEARNEAEARFLFQRNRGYFDPDPDFAFPDEYDIEIDELPMLTGEPTFHNAA
ncbi:MAG: hypothetical protein ABWY63_14280 [Hyphomicrobiaceae bacterium]